MKEYHKIHTMFCRDSDTGELLDGLWAKEEFEYLANNQWVWTEKVDGMNIRVGVENGEVCFGGRTDKAQIPGSLVARMVEMFPKERMNEVFSRGQNVCLYGEGYGPKIQAGGGNYRSDQSFVLFDVLVGGWWLRRGAVEDVASQLGIDVVPVVGCGTLHEAIEFVRQGPLSTWGEFPSEGIVARPSVELRSRSGDRIIAKIKRRDFRP